MRIVLAMAATTLFLAASAHAAGGLRAPADSPAAPEFTHAAAEDWINSPPLKWAQLRGRVVLLDFWTFACWNCFRSFPWLNGVERAYAAQGLTIIGVHTPELPHERVRSNVLRKIEEYGLSHPVMVDDDFSYWNALRNRYWPAFYLFDKRGRLRATFFGETHAGDAQARRIDRAIKTLLAEEPDA